MTLTDRPGCVAKSGALALLGAWLALPLAAPADDEYPSLDREVWDAVLTDEIVADLLGRVTKDLAKQTRSAGYFRRYAPTMEIDAVVITALGNIEAIRSEGVDHAKACSLREAGYELIEACADRDFDAAQEAATQILAYPAEIEPYDEPEVAYWDEILDLDLLMKAVSLAETGYEKALPKEGDDATAAFTGRSEEGAYFAQLQAIYGLIARDFDVDDWVGWCDEMRDQGVALAVGFREQDTAKILAAHELLQQSCVDCHVYMGIEEE